MEISLHTGSFLAAFSLMMLHEMDAVRCHEWRIFPLLSSMSDRSGMLVFFWLHVPLVWLLVWYGAESVRSGGDGFSIGFAMFCIAHAFFHWAYERYPECEFKNALSRSIIWACAGFGFLSALAYWN